MNKNDLRDSAFDNARKHGFHDEEHSNKHLICLIVSELMEAVEADRNGRYTDKTILPYFKEPEEYSRKGAYEEYFTCYVKDSVGDELADACIRIYDLAGLRSVNLNQTNVIYTNTSSKAKCFTESIFDICKVLMSPYPLSNVLINSLRMIEELCKHINVDLQRHIELKMKYNVLRPTKHGKKY